jgi:hypothetical protein
MRGWIFLVSCFCCVWVGRVFGDEAVKGTAGRRVLAIERSVMKVAGGKATLSIGELRRTNDVFGGEFQMKVVPYFFKNEKGSLAISITDGMIARAAKGDVVEITGTATTAGKNGATRPINAVATPVDGEHGALRLWFMVEERKMIFETSYRFVE